MKENYRNVPLREYSLVRECLSSKLLNTALICEGGSQRLHPVVWQSLLSLAVTGGVMATEFKFFINLEESIQCKKSCVNLTSLLLLVFSWFLQVE